VERVRKSINAVIEKAADGADGQWVISSVNKDRAGDTIEPSALEAQVGKSLPALFGHDSSKIVGKWVIDKFVKTSGKLYASLHLSATGLGTMLKTLLSDQVPISASIGFFGSGDYNREQGGYHFNEVDIFETSLVAVPANADAVRVKSLAVGLDPEPLFTSPDQPGQAVAKKSMAQRVILSRAAAAINDATAATHPID
jgi:HK97 family phage prohead protease